MKNETTPSNLFNEVAKEWLHNQKPLLKPSSYVKYYNIINNYLSPELGEIEICSITRKRVHNLCRKLLLSGGVRGRSLSPKTVNCAIAVLKNIFTYSLRELGLSIENISDISVKQVPHQMRVLSIIEQSNLSNYLCENLTPCNLGILICLYTGIRIGEICALKWQDIYFNENCLHIRKTMQRIQTLTNSCPKTKLVVLPPKSISSIRKIPIPFELKRMLMCNRKDPNCYVLTGDTNRFIEPRSLENQFKTVIQKCKIDQANFHALRHTFATRCIELDFDIKSLSEILGHSNVNITLNRYVHPSMELKQINMNKLSQFLGKKQ